MFYYIRRFWEVPREESRLFLYGLLISGTFFVITHTFHLKYYKNIISERPLNKAVEEVNTIRSVKILKKTLKRVVRIFPLKLNCLIKGITFKILADSLKLDCSLAFDAVKLEDGELIAHSYISRNNEIIYLGTKRFKDPDGLLIIT